VGTCDSDPGRHTGADSVRDLHALLTTAAVPGPYLLVGFSFGGLLAIMDAATYPDQVMGLVSLDGSLPTDDEVDRLIPADERARVLAEQEANQERVEFYRTVDQAKARRSATPSCRWPCWSSPRWGWYLASRRRCWAPSCSGLGWSPG
jgi:pimeloyl-ACP methyl ester carboxylesterase